MYSSKKRWCDVSDITYRNIDYANKLLIFEQNKTRGHSSAIGVVIPLNEDILSLVGQPETADDRDNRIFPFVPPLKSTIKINL